MPTYRLTLEYDGTRFAGWQVLPRGRTVQGTLLEALRSATGQEEIDLQGAGRTDAGVHALAQVASLRVPQPIACGRTLRLLEELLPGDVAVRELVPAPRGFHARHDAQARVYRYQLALRRSAFGKRYSWWVGELDLESLQQAAKLFLGRHDFRHFVRRASHHESTVVVMEGVEMRKVGDVVVLRFTASHFLWHQVRRMVGALVEVGKGRAQPRMVVAWLKGSEPVPSLAAPPAGLFLEAVFYPGQPRHLPPPLPVGIPLASPHLEGNLAKGES